MSHAYRRIVHEVRSKKWRLLWGFFFENSPFLREFMKYLMQTTPQRRQGRGSSGPESLFEVNGRSRKSKTLCSSKAKRRVKSPPDSGTVDSDWYVLCFNLAQVTLYSSWHVLGCVNFVLGSPDMFVIWIPHVYHMRESIVRVYAMETPKELSKCNTHC